MSDYCFYAADIQGLIADTGIKEKIDSYSEANKKQTYVLQRPLSKDDATYDYDQAIVIFISGKRPCFVNIGDNEDAFKDYIDDFIEDISFLSEKFRYRERIGRKKHWSSLFKSYSADKLDFESLDVDKISDSRIVDLLASLVIGSINDVKKINLEPIDILDLVKSKIILFDTDQTSFVFRTGAGKKYVIQGLAGSGKTELLLHKIKEIYSRDSEARIAFTCFNKILASSMKSRIPEFFDFMRVERQIEWDKKLFCFHSWGSGRDPLSGMYRYICHCYGITFGSLQSGSFDDLCKRATDSIKEITGERKYIFDYIFIDESQDFSNSFIDLCELVTAKKVFVAGDVFQNIFRPIDEKVSQANMILKKCYRTDPKNLMFSHALGMGLFETPVLRWLKPEEWDACGYIYNVENERAVVSRDPLRRFEDIPHNFKSTSLHQWRSGTSIADTIIEVIESIRLKHPSTKQGDIAVIFLDRDNYIYDVIAQLKFAISERFHWDVNVSFESKMSDPNKFFISNINNAKGLEFPFVICFAMNLNRNRFFRNALYTMMARSFLESHLVLGRAEATLVNDIVGGLNYLSERNEMNLRVPAPEEIAHQEKYIVLEEPDSLESIVRNYCSDKQATPRLIAKLISRMEGILADSDYEREYIDTVLRLEYERHKSL